MKPMIRHRVGWWGIAALSMSWFAVACASSVEEKAAGRAEDDLGQGDGIDVQAGDIHVALSRGTLSSAVLPKDADSAITVTLTNRGSRSVRMLAWSTLLEGIEAPLFDVRRDGEPVPYIGRLYKRAAPVAGDYVVLAPGERLVRTVNLAEAYDLSISGNYRVQFRADLPGLAGHTQRAAALLSNDLDLWLVGRPAPAREPDHAFDVYGGGEPSAQPFRYYGCSDAQAKKLQDGLVAAEDYAINSYYYLVNHTASTPRFTTWFGTFSPAARNTVGPHFTNLANTFVQKNFFFDCATCTRPNVYAYVYPDRPYNVYLCPVVWNRPIRGTDSVGGTLVHETSHFLAVAGTRDYAYGQSACRSLATSNPANALQNADSHEYFAENNPVLP
ncbi:M35 family metallo-endopeptidase [Pendulispora albinea]|uniref:M35 family metallo-endopeptidase n=1 Tax=Pendulispora albinea TaxID=2741071 RepID=A0ABZ2M8F9_9BACT